MVVREFDSSVAAGRYIRLYEEVLSVEIPTLQRMIGRQEYLEQILYPRGHLDVSG